MARGINRLSGADLRRSKPGMYADGGGLALQVSVAADGKRRNKSWTFRYTANGRTREMGLGSLDTIGLAEARERARKCRQLRLDGIDPIEARDAERAAKAAASAKTTTFEECAARYIAAHRAEWRNEQHAKDWPDSLRRHVYPTLGRLPVTLIDTALVLKALQGVWETAPETGSRVRGRIEAILDWAGVSGFRDGNVPNPARWSGHLEHLLPAARKVRPLEHLAALPWREVPAFMAQLRAIDTVVARAFEFGILTAARRNEVLGACWSEMNLAESIWTVPSTRMKSGREHRVPLPPRCVKILREIQATRQGDIVFVGRDGRGRITESAFQRLVKRLGRKVTPHGFRSSFRDFGAESTNFPREVCEAALAHAVGDQVERAYRRGDALEKRAKLMCAWANFCAGPASAGATVTTLRKAGSNA